LIADPGVAEELAFRLDVFFVGRTSGSGVLRDPLGRITRRFSIDTRGRRDDSYGAINLDETCAFDNGEVEVLRWVIAPAGAGRYVLAEAGAGSGIIGQVQHGDLTFAYHRAQGAARGLASPRYSVRMTMLTPETVLRTVRVSLLGAPLGHVTMIHRQLRQDPSA
jgi:hypothetical protein